MSRNKVGPENFLKTTAGAIGGLALSGKAMDGLAAVPYEENPLVGCIDSHVHSARILPAVRLMILNSPEGQGGRHAGH